MLTVNYKNALKGFHDQAQGKGGAFPTGCEYETQHIYRIIMTENIPVNEMDVDKLSFFLLKEKAGDADYSQSVDCDGLEYVDFDQDVDVYPCMRKGHNMLPMTEHTYILSAKAARELITQLICLNSLSLITDTIQSLAQRSDGTYLQSAFPALSDVKACILRGLILPPALVESLKTWEGMGASDIFFDFVERQDRSKSLGMPLLMSCNKTA